MAISKLIEWMDAFGIVKLPEERTARAKRIGGLVQSYLDNLADLPGDLLIDAVEAVKRNHTMHVAPLPGEIRKMAAEELSRRHLNLTKLECVIRFGHFKRAPVPAAERVAPARLAALREELAERARLRDAADHGEDEPQA